jgi:hypothetical protein
MTFSIEPESGTAVIFVPAIIMGSSNLASQGEPNDVENVIRAAYISSSIEAPAARKFVDGEVESGRQLRS